MATPRSTRLRGGPITPTSASNRFGQPSQADLPILDTANNLLYGSTIPALPKDSETGARLTQSSIAKNMAGSRSAASQQAPSERLTRGERAARRELVYEASIASGAPSEESNPPTRGNSVIPLAGDPLIDDDLPVPPDSERPGSGGTASRTWGLETGYNGRAKVGIGQGIQPGGFEQAVTPTRGKGVLRQFHDNLGEHGGLRDSEVPDNSSDTTVLSQHEQFDGRSSTPSFAVWAVQLSGRLAFMALTLVLLLLIPLGVKNAGLLQGIDFSRFSMPAPANYPTSGLTREILNEANNAISAQYNRLSNELQNVNSKFKGIAGEWAEYKEKWAKSKERLAESEERWTEFQGAQKTELEKIYAILGKLTQSSLMHDESVKALRSMIPELTWVSRSGTGDIVIQQDFWLALRSKIEHEFGRPKSSSKDPDLWAQFLEHNESRMRPYIADAVEGHLRKAGNDGVLVTKEHLLTIIQANYEKHSRETRQLNEVFEEKYRTMDRRLDNINKDMERKVAVTAMQKVEALSDRISRTLPAAQLEALVQANIDRNSQQALTSINFFSPGMGAVTDQRYCSGAYNPQRSLMNRFLSLFIPMGAYTPKEPEVALYGWEEPLDCWCSSNTSDKDTLGNAQIAVSTAVHVYPTDITIEHIPRTAVPSVRNAPKDMELWVTISNSTLYDKLEEESEALLGPTPPRGDKLSDGWLRIASWRYTPYGVNHVLNFPVQVDLERLQIPGKYFLVRATTNWDAGFTCFYRVRMGGKVVDQNAWNS
ncbi:hypothetical protein GP486_000014 [Trichoglossum hirsutum]|uniref:SUN domain-containing protein n=1 Tax=Trichoglossum hirsutum TaxID=265104 RepID=A0A9P8LJN2_9PEZI|nr:hypothetical protein GP486_000014 [Trichoglossum hirsutum]